MLKKISASFSEAVKFSGTLFIALVGLTFWHGSCVNTSGNPLGSGLILSSTTSTNVPFFSPTSPSLQIAANWSISFWINTTSIANSNNRPSFIEYPSVGNSKGFAVNDNTFFGLGISLFTAPGVCGLNDACLPQAKVINDGKNHLLTGTYDGANLSFYLDGALVYLTSATYSTSSSPLRIGGSDGSGTPNFSGTFIDMRLYNNYVLTADDVRTLYSLGKSNLVPSSGPMTLNLAAYWPMSASTITGSGNSTVVHDASGNGNDFIIDTVPPGVSVTAPANNATISGSSVTLMATCTDNIGCSTVQFNLDGTNYGSAVVTSPYTITLDSTVVADGTHIISAIGSDYAGNKTTASISVTTSNGRANHNWYFANVGSNSNDCQSTGSACQTIGKLNSLTYLPGDTINLNGGDTFTDACMVLTTTSLKFGVTSNPLIVQSYGTGNFTIAPQCTGGTSGAIQLAGVSGTIVKNCIVRSGGSTSTTMPRSGIIIQNPNAALMHDVVVKSCDISGFQYLTTNGDFGGEIFVIGSQGGPIDSVSLINNTLHGSSGVGSVDDNGITGFGGAAMTNFIYQGNLVYNIGGTSSNSFGGSQGNGILMSGVTGGNNVMQYNVVHDIGGNTITCGGPAGLWTANSNNVIIQYNEVYNVQPISYSSGCDWDGTDLDISVRNSVVQFNYFHNNFGAGALAFMSGTWGPNTIRYNVTEKNNTRGFYGEVSLTNGGGLVYVYNNTMYSLSNSINNGYCVQTQGQNPDKSSVFANNICWANVGQDGSSRYVNWANVTGVVPSEENYNDFYTLTSSPQWRTNSPNAAYATLALWRAVSGFDVNSLNVDPQLTSPGAGGTCNTTVGTTGPQPCPSSYNLTGSNMKGVGVDLTQPPYNLNVGTRDFYGNTIPHATGTGYNIGADGHN